MFAVSFPGVDALKTIYHSILQGHISANNLPTSVGKIAEKLVDCALAMNQKVCRKSRMPHSIGVIFHGVGTVYHIVPCAVLRCVVMRYGRIRMVCNSTVWCSIVRYGVIWISDWNTF